MVVLGVAYGLWKVPRLFKWWFGLLTAPVVLALAFCREVLRGHGLWWKARKVVPAAAAEAAEAAQQAAAVAAVECAATPTAAPAHEQQDPAKKGGDEGVAIHAIATARDTSDTSAAASQRPQTPGSSSSSGRSSKKVKKQKGRVLPEGAWWPKSFGPVDLAITSHWYTSVLGWQLATW
jgi:hypothetical protein